MKLDEKLKKIDSDIENGLKSKAADKLRRLIQEYPNEMGLWNQLAELYYDSGFLDNAGKYWILTEPREERMKKCVELYEQSVNYSGYQILQEIVFRGDSSKLPVYAQQKLSELELDSYRKMHHIPKFTPKKAVVKKNMPQKQTIFDKMLGTIFVSLMLFLGILIIVGLVTVIQSIF